MTFMIGVIQLGISLFRLGDLTRNISHSVIVGFTFGAATQWSGVISAVGVAAIMLVFAPYAQYLPKATPAAMLLFALGTAACATSPSPACACRWWRSSRGGAATPSSPP